MKYDLWPLSKGFATASGPSSPGALSHCCNWMQGCLHRHVLRSDGVLFSFRVGIPESVGRAKGIDQNVMTSRPLVPPASSRRCASLARSAG